MLALMGLEIGLVTERRGAIQTLEIGLPLAGPRVLLQGLIIGEDAITLAADQLEVIELVPFGSLVLLGSHHRLLELGLIFKQSNLEESTRFEEELHLIVLDVDLAMIDEGENLLQDVGIHLDGHPQVVAVLEEVGEDVQNELVYLEHLVMTLDLEVSLLFSGCH